MEIKLWFCSIPVGCVLSILSPLPGQRRAESFPLVPWVYLPQTHHLPLHPYWDPGLRFDPVLWNLSASFAVDGIANSLIYAFWSSVSSAVCPQLSSRTQMPISLPIPPQCCTATLCRVSLWLQAKPNIVWFLFVSCCSPSPFPFLSELFHAPVLYSGPLARVILSHFFRQRAWRPEVYYFCVNWKGSLSWERKLLLDCCQK